MLKRRWILKHDPIQVIRMPGSIPVTGLDEHSSIEVVAREDYDKLRAEMEELRERLAAVKMLNEELHWKIYGQGGRA